LEIRPKQIEEDSLKISEVTNKKNKLLTDFRLRANTPIVSFEKDSISFINQDSLAIDFELALDTLYNQLTFKFEKEEKQSYKIDLLPGAITDFFETQNDSLSYRYSTRALADFGNLNLTITNIEEFPIIVELVDDKGDVESTVYETEKSTVNFKLITPGSYFIRLVYDKNANGKWDTGNFLKGLNPEPVLYEAQLVEIRANWDVQLSITLF
jgi:hypothetical protein